MDGLQVDDERLETAVRAATTGGAIAEIQKETAARERKANDTFVTDADKNAETEIRAVLNEDSPHPVLGEEHGGDINGDTYWVVDPIDGTQNFAYHQPLYGSAIALVENGEPTVGCFQMPELNYMFYAVDGKGAYRNEEQIHVNSGESSNQPYPVATGYGSGPNFEGITAINEFTQRFSCALMAEGWVASGWNDVGVAGALGPWDIAVGAVLVREAGGVVETLDNGETDWDAIQDGGILFGSRGMVDKARNALSPTTIETLAEKDYPE